MIPSSATMSTTETIGEVFLFDLRIVLMLGCLVPQTEQTCGVEKIMNAAMNGMRNPPLTMAKPMRATIIMLLCVNRR